MSRSPGSVAPSEAIARLVAGCRRRASAAHLARALCGGLAAALVIVALVAAGGRPWGDPEGLALGAAIGLLTLLGWARSARVSDAEVARAIDRSLPGAGLLAAYEGARRGSSSPLRELAARRAYRAVPRVRADAAVVPVAVPFLVLPLGAVAALLLAVQMGDADAARARARAEALRGLARDLAAAADEHAGALGAAGAEALDGVADEVGAAAAGEARAAPSVRWSERIESAAASAPPDVREALQRLALDAELAAPEGDPRAPETRSAGERSAGPSPAGAAGAPVQMAAGEAAAGSPEGSLADAGPVDGGPVDGDPSDAGPPGAISADAPTAEEAEGAAGHAAGGGEPAAGGRATAGGGRAGAGAAPGRGAASAAGESGEAPGAADAGAASSPASEATADGAKPPAERARGVTPSGTPAPPTVAPPRHRALVRAWLATRR